MGSNLWVLWVIHRLFVRIRDILRYTEPIHPITCGLVPVFPYSDNNSDAVNPNADGETRTLTSCDTRT